jgi:hypothetical protein
MRLTNRLSSPSLQKFPFPPDNVSRVREEHGGLGPSECFVDGPLVVSETRSLAAEGPEANEHRG